MIVNESKETDYFVNLSRSHFEHRALWLLLLCREAEKKGLAWEDFALDAIAENGKIDGKALIEKGGPTMRGLHTTLFTTDTQKIFDMDVKTVTDNELSINFHYCPLVKAWQDQGCTDKEIGRLCDIAMRGDHLIAQSYGGELELPQSIAKGDSKCELHFRIPVNS